MLLDGSTQSGQRGLRQFGLFILLPASFSLLIAFLPLPYAFGLLIGLAFGVLALIDPIWALYAAVLSVPFQEVVQLPGGLSVTQACLLLALGALGLHTLAHPERRLPLGRLFWPLAIFVWALALASAFTPYSRSEALRETLRWSTVLLIYVLTLASMPQAAVGSTGRPADWRLIGLLLCLLLAPAASGLLGAVQHFTGDGPPSFEVAPGRVRAYGTIGQPNSFAGYMNQAWPLAAGIALFALVEVGRIALASRGALPARAEEPPHPAPPSAMPLILLLVAGGLGGLIGAGLLLSYSRGGWVGALGGGAALLLAAITRLEPRLRRIAWAWVLAGAVGLGALLSLGGAGLLPAPLANRLASITGNLRLFDVRSVEVNPVNFAVVERMAHLQAGWGMLQAYPLLGVGPGNYSIAFNHDPAVGEPTFAVRPWYDSRGHAHNYYLHIAAEAGLVGAGAYLLLLGAIARQARRALAAARGWLWSGVVVGCIGVTAAVATHNIFENLHVLNMGLQLGTIWALLAAVERDL